MAWLLVGASGSLLGCSSEDKTADSDDSSEMDNADESSQVDDSSTDEPEDPSSPAAPTSSAGPEPAGPNPTDPNTEPSTTPTAEPSPTASSPVVAPVPPPDPNLGTIGAACELDTQCQVGLTCLVDGSFFTGDGSGTIARGLCTARCEQDPYLCQNYSSQATCILNTGGTEDTSDDEGLCVEQCAVGDGLLKCQGNPDQVCLPLQDSSAICVPFCLDDLGCAAGQFCDPLSGLCVEEAPSGAAYGEPCATNEECVGGGCVFATEEQQGLCSGPCTVTGLVAGCGLSADEGAAPDALCLPLVEGYGVGDPGLCAPMCDSDDDCHLEQLYCAVLGDPETEAALGRRGFCMPVDAAAMDAGAPALDDVPEANDEADDDSAALDAGSEPPVSSADAAPL